MNLDRLWLGEPSIWRTDGWEAQTMSSGTREAHRFVEGSASESARIGVALLGNHLHPLFGAQRQHVYLVSGPAARGDAEVEGLVVSPGIDVRICPGSWHSEFVDRGWTVERRVRSRRLYP